MINGIICVAGPFCFTGSVISPKVSVVPSVLVALADDLTMLLRRNNRNLHTTTKAEWTCHANDAIDHSFQKNSNASVRIILLTVVIKLLNEV